MNSTVYVPTVILNLIEDRFEALTGRKMTQNELETFLEEDIMAIYTNHVHNGLDDALSEMM